MLEIKLFKKTKANCIYIPKHCQSNQYSFVGKVQRKLHDAAAQSRGIKHFFLYNLISILKAPQLANLVIRRIKLLVKTPDSQDGKLLLELNNFGFSFLHSFSLPKSLIEGLKSDFKNKFNLIDASSKSESPVAYFPVKEKYSREILSLLIHSLPVSITKYLYYTPYLKNISYMFSTNRELHDDSSQFWHLDKQGPRTLKIFIALCPLSIENGPLTFIDAQRSRYIDNQLRYVKTGSNRRISDEKLAEEFCNLEFEESKFLAEEGKVLFLDTDRCFHYGSRKATKSRLLLLIEFGSLLDYRAPALLKVDLKKLKTPTLH